MAEDYTRGDMTITEQKRTFGNFISISTYGAAVTAVTVLFLSLVFGSGINWLTGLIITAIVGVVLGVVLKRGTAYWITVSILGVIAVLAGFVIAGLFGS